MTLKLAYNTTETPALVDAAGYQIGGRDWGVVDSTDDLARDGYAAGILVDADEDALAASDNPLALAAVAALTTRRDREAAAHELSKAELVAALPPDVVGSLEVGGDGLPPKSDLVDAVVASDDPVPAPEPETTTTSRRTAAKQK